MFIEKLVEKLTRQQSSREGLGWRQNVGLSGLPTGGAGSSEAGEITKRAYETREPKHWPGPPTCARDLSTLLRCKAHGSLLFTRLCTVPAQRTPGSYLITCRMNINMIPTL